MNRRSCILLLTIAALTLSWDRSAGAQTQPSGELVWALHVSISPSWFDPGENGGLITPFAVLYALHDGLVYEFTLRQGLRFHNGDPCTAEDVQFSFERYKGGGATELTTTLPAMPIPPGPP